ALNSLRRYLEHPRQDQRNRQTDDDQQDDQPNHPIRNIEDRENLRDSLGQRPAADDVSHRDLVNVATLQLGKEISARHLDAVPALNSRAGTIFSASASKRG